MINRGTLLFFLAAGLGLGGCAGVSQTEADFRNSVENVIAKQQMAPTGTLGPNEPIETGDGRRLENVNTVYQTRVGDPSPVVRQVEIQVEQGEQ